MVVLNPSYLWALVGLAVPIAIHLWSKKQGKTIQIGQIKFLKTSDSQKSKRLRLSELVLLLLRMLILGFIVLLLAEPRLDYKAENAPVIYLIEPSLLTSPKLKSLADSLQATSTVRYLKTDFPEYQPEVLNTSLQKTPQYWQLAKAMEDLTADSIVVFTNAFVKGIKGKRPEVKKKIHWIHLNSEEPQTHLVGSVKKGQRVEQVSAVSTAELFKFQKETKDIEDARQDHTSAIELDTLQVKVFSESDFDAEDRYIKASLKAIEDYLSQPIQISSLKDTTNFNSQDLLVWLSYAPAPDVDGLILKYKEDPFADALISPGINPDEFYLTNKLNSENIVSEHLAEQLLGVLDVYAELKQEAEMYDLRVMNPALLDPVYSDVSASSHIQEAKDMSAYMWWVLLFLLASERVLATFRKQ